MVVSFYLKLYCYGYLTDVKSQSNWHMYHLLSEGIPLTTIAAYITITKILYLSCRFLSSWILQACNISMLYFHFFLPSVISFKTSSTVCIISSQLNPYACRSPLATHCHLGRLFILCLSWRESNPIRPKRNISRTLEHFLP